MTINRLFVFRWLFGVILLGIALLFGVHVINYIRLDPDALEDSARVLIDRVRQVHERARSEYQEHILATLAPNPVNGSFYRFDDMLPQATVIEEPPRMLLDDKDGFLFHLEFDNDDGPRIVAAGAKSKLDRRNGLLVVTQRDGDYITNETPFRIPRAHIGDIIIRARADKGSRFLLGWEAERKDGPKKDQISLDLISDGKFHTYVVNAKNALKRGVKEWENISKLILTPSNIDGALVEIDYIRIISRHSKYQSAPKGTDYETISGDMRPVLYMVPMQALEYAINVPEKAPVLSFGTGVLFEDLPVEFSVSIITDKGTTRLYDERIVSASAWRDVRLDMAPWAGQKARVIFRVRGANKNVAFWSNPLVYSAPNNRFNVIIILEDALRADHLSTHGHVNETSPMKTQLMDERGVVFLNAISQATKTRPSVPALMTSLYPTATGVWNFSDMLSERYLTLAEIMRSQGFATASFIQNGNAGPYAGLHQGFSTLFDDESLGKKTEEVFGARMISWLERNRDRNVFLYLHAGDPHGPYDPPPPYDRWYREARLETGVDMKTEGHLDPEWLKNPTAEARRLLYDGEIRHNDAVIGEFVAKLAELNLLEDTLLIFVSDHGEWMGELDQWEHHPPGNMPVIHVPLMIVYPRLFDKPKRIPETVQLIDVMPTILELAGVHRSDLLLHGESLVGLIKGQNLAYWQDRVTVSEEPMVMSRDNPCLCGSLFFREWQIHGSIVGWPSKISSPFIKTKVHNFRKNGVRVTPLFTPDLYVRYVRHSIISNLYSANISAWKKLTSGEEQDLYKMDPGTLERLRGLGYTN